MLILLKINVVLPSLTEISAVFFIFSMFSFNEVFKLKTQSITFYFFFENIDLNFFNCAFESIGLVLKT